jgi:hypothetical protein
MKNRKKEEPKIELPFETTPRGAYVHVGTVDSVSLHLPPMEGNTGYSQYIDGYAATTEMLDEMIQTIKCKQMERVDTKSETLQITKQGIFWKRYR